jgi:uncharacterized protein YegJ (DUF2314 family)
MMRRTSSILLTLGVCLALLAACTTRRARNYVEDNEPEMVAAIARARHTLPQFWQAFEKRDDGETQFTLKFRIIENKRVEHFWVTNFVRQGRKVIVTINQTPKIVASVKQGDRLEIPEAEIQDWFYMRAGKMVGCQTIRPMFKMMPEKTVTEFKNALEDP